MSEPKWKNRIVRTGEQPAGEFLANPGNWRVHPKAQRAALSGVLSEVGWVTGVIVNRTTGHMLDGHARVEEALKLGDETPVPFIEVELTEDEEKTVLATFDPISAMAAADKEQLDALLKDVSTASEGVQSMLAELAKDNGLDYGSQIGGALEDAEPQIDKAAELARKWGTARGQVWRLGEHRLLCGDSTRREDVERVMGGERADAVVTDPPYGIDYKSGHDGALPRSIAGDKDTSVRDAAVFFDMSIPIACFATWRCKPPKEPRGQLVWAKNVGGMGDLSFPWKTDYEVIWIFGKGWSGHRGSAVLRGETIVTWNSASASRNHPHEKPVQVLSEIVAKAPGSVIYEPFAGSGTTIVACQQLGRKCRAIEISPAYVAVILERMKTAFPLLEIEKVD